MQTTNSIHFMHIWFRLRIRKTTVSTTTSATSAANEHRIRCRELIRASMPYHNTAAKHCRHIHTCTSVLQTYTDRYRNRTKMKCTDMPSRKTNKNLAETHVRAHANDAFVWAFTLCHNLDAPENWMMPSCNRYTRSYMHTDTRSHTHIHLTSPGANCAHLHASPKTLTCWWSGTLENTPPPQPCERHDCGSRSKRPVLYSASVCCSSGHNCN